MRNLVAGLVFAIFVFAAGFVAAQEMYVGVFGGYAFEAFDQDAIWTGIGADPDEVNGSWAAGVLVGYGITENIDIVGDFAYYFAFSPDEDALEDFEASLWTITGGVKYSFSYDATWTPYVVGGLGWGKLEGDGGLTIPDEDGVADDEQSGLVARVGGGVEYAFGENTMLFADVGYVFTFGDIEDWNFFDVRVGIGMGF